MREIRGHLEELHGVSVSPGLISRMTDAVLEEVREWQNRPLDPPYPVVFFDALQVKIRGEGQVWNKAVYLALALISEGEKEVLGLWVEQREGAKFRLKVMNELQSRGLRDILIAVGYVRSGVSTPVSPRYRPWACGSARTDSHAAGGIDGSSRAWDG